MGSGSFERLPPRIGGKYKPIRLVGTGGMSAVYEVEHEHTGERLALKVLKDGIAELDPAALARFRREARVAALVKSEHIVRVVDADLAPELDGAPFLVMDLLEGGDLSELTGDEPQPPEAVVGWLRQVAKALDKAHALGVVHRDLKPENLFLEDRPEGGPIVKILDFGVAKVRTQEDSRKTATGSVVGTPLYMAPEQAAGEASKIGPGTDIWAIGLLAYRFLTGKDYWVATTVPALLAKIVYAKVDPPSARGTDLGAAFDAWFLRSCAPDPTDRWPSVTQQVERLADALGVALPESSDSKMGVVVRPLRASVSGNALDETMPAPPKARAEAATQDARSSQVVALSLSNAPAKGRYRLAVTGAVIGVAAISWLVVFMQSGRAPAPAAAPSASSAPAEMAAAAPTTTPSASVDVSAAPAPSESAAVEPASARASSAPGAEEVPPTKARAHAAPPSKTSAPAIAHGSVAVSTPVTAAVAAPPVATVATPPPAAPAPPPPDPLSDPH